MPALRSCRDEIVRLRPEDLVRTGDDGFAVVDIGFVDFQPVGAGTFEAIEVESTLAVKHLDVVHEFFEGTLEFPLVVVLVVVVRADEDGYVGIFRGFEEALDVGHGVVLGDALADHAPCDALRTEEVVLWIGDDKRRPGP